MRRRINFASSVMLATGGFDECRPKTGISAAPYLLLISVLSSINCLCYLGNWP